MATPPYALLLASLGLLSPSAWAAGLCPQQPIRLAFYESGLFYYEGKGVDVDLVKELQRRSGCMVRGVSYGVPRDKWTTQMTAAGRVQIAPTPAIAYRMLQGGRFSALFAIPMQYEKELKDRGLRDQMTIIDWFPQEPPTTRNLALSRKRFTTEQLAAWNALAKTLSSDGTMQAILQRYLTPSEAAKAMPK
ncbi:MULTISPECIES: hypothetical protein [unclassified Duganella]|uniref:hypothetical protein n=1 Tax=unclassified Duganella TaxID=2636909 RepID=UPI00088445D2|nr:MULTISPECIES: hypothetical protein [unclassified Duganella]SDH02116.1 hypothetical protein SAMN05216320_10917 [Duganella sp. OV458]SDK24099.1 hypothetical protein SAMN05428973_109265 [Duganella sp. OV510]